MPPFTWSGVCAAHRRMISAQYVSFVTLVVPIGCLLDKSSVMLLCIFSLQMEDLSGPRLWATGGCWQS